MPSHGSIGKLHFAPCYGVIDKDPFDRMLAAQATVERLTLVTRDPGVAT